MKFYVKDIAALFHCNTYERSFDDVELHVAETDSRHILNPAETLFFALKGSRTDGHDFIPQLIEQGVRVFVVQDSFTGTFPTVCLLRVSNVLEALQTLAAAHRSRFHIPVIGITGSNGKTIVKEWLSLLLQEKFKICKNPKSYNSQLGVALSVLELDASHQLALFEAGISKTGEMDALLNMIQPNIGLMTNIGDAHQAGFSGMDEKTREKLKLFANVQTFVYCKDYQSIHYQRAGKTGNVCWSQKMDADYVIRELRKQTSGLRLTIAHKGTDYQFQIHFEDEASLENVMHCIVMCLELGLTQQEIQQGLQLLYSLSMRLEQKEGLNGCILINDSYSLDFKSLQLALQFADQQNQQLPRTLILSDFAEQKSPESLWPTVDYLLNKYRIQRVIGVGQHIAGLKDHLSSSIRFQHFETPEILIEQLDALRFHNELILIKAARRFRLERLFHLLSLSKHDTILEIDLKALVHNVAVYKSLLKPATRVMAIVKAASYGSGHYEVAQLLEQKQVDYLAVAYLDEGILLRQKGIRVPIMVMNTATADFRSLEDYQLEPEIFCLAQIKRLIQELGPQRRFSIHIKLDTGMYRLGFTEHELDELILLLKHNPQLTVVSIFSHLSASDQADYDAFTREQASRFERMSTRITDALGYAPLRHLLNSGGIARHPELQYDMIRLGIGMYGIDSVLGPRLEKVHTLKTRISQVKPAEAGARISYNRSGVLSQEGKIGILSIGYADGLPRVAGLQAYKVWLNRQRIPLIGVVCMDMCMVDLSELEHVAEGMEVEVFGKNAPVEELAQASGTIAYEVLSRISGRVKRVFLQD